jgi:hypothetical protein
MKVTYDGADYDFDFDEITVQQAKTIKDRCKMTLRGLEEGLAEGDADALRALYWLMLCNTGITEDIDTVDFKIVKFSKALQDATAARDEELAAAEKAKTAPRKAKAKAVTAPEE